MPIRKSFSVQEKMTGIIFLISMLVMMLTSMLFIFFELKHIQDFAEEDLNSMAKVISANAALPMALNDHVAMQSIVDSLGARKDVSSVYLLTENGQVLVSYNAKPPPNTEAQFSLLEKENNHIRNGLLGEQFTWEESGFLAHLEPVHYEGRLVGYSYLSFETSSQTLQKIYLALGWLLTMGAATLVTYFLSSRLQRHITEPVAELASMMKKISLEKRLVSSDHQESKDEFNMLFEGFDEMINALKERDLLLEKHRRNLELEVQVRTRALEAEKEKAEQATMAKSKFLANMSHEIRTPMIGVLGMADILRNRELDNYDRDLVETIYRSGEALLTILNDILDFSKIEAGRLKFDAAPVDLQQVLKDVVQLMQVNAQSKGIELKSETPDEIPLVTGDIGRIRQILLNLIGNAIKFTDSGAVSASLAISKDETAGICNALFVVKDTGPGIPNEDQLTIFEPFSQGQESTKQSQGGTGLGLSIVKDLLQSMGGEIKLESELGKGSTFTVSLPFSIADAKEISQFTAHSRAPLAPATGDNGKEVSPDFPREGLRILLAEDNPTTQNLISILIGQMGFDLTIVDNGLDAVEFLERDQVDLILMDCQMPKMDGYKATSILRTKGLKTPIVALTAYARAEDEEECLAAGMDDFLSKPFRQSEIRAMLIKWLPKQKDTDLQSVGNATLSII